MCLWSRALVLLGLLAVTQFLFLDRKIHYR